MSTQTQSLLNDPLVSTQQLGRLIDTKPRTIERWRLLGTGPSFIRVNSRLVRYRLSEIESWLRASRAGREGQERAA